PGPSVTARSYQQTSRFLETTEPGSRAFVHDISGPSTEARRMIVIVDYGMGNLRSVQKAIEAVGSTAEITSDPDRVRQASKVVLPGVGAFADAMAELRRTGLGEAFREAVHKGKPCLGVCLGLQLLFELSLEDGEHSGLGLLPGRVVRFAPQPGLKVPHLGLNTLRIR